MATRETHYAYIVTPCGRDIATKTFNLNGVKSEKRREIIGQLINNGGECLAQLPLKFKMQDKAFDLNELTSFINGETR